MVLMLTLVEYHITLTIGSSDFALLFGQTESNDLIKQIRMTAPKASLCMICIFFKGNILLLGNMLYMITG